MRHVEIDNSQTLTYDGFKSLVNRGVARVTSTAIGHEDAYALDTELFEYAQTVRWEPPF